MGEWGQALLFGLALLTLVLGASSIIMGLLPQPVGAGMKEKVEYSFFGISGLVIGILFTVALTW